MPQKNISTFMHTSLAVAPETDFTKFQTSTDHQKDMGNAASTRRAYGEHYKRREPVQGSRHYHTTNVSKHSGHPGVKLTVPLGKGGWDRTATTLPMPRGEMPSLSHSAAMYRGEQLAAVLIQLAWRQYLFVARAGTGNNAWYSLGFVQTNPGTH